MIEPERFRSAEYRNVWDARPSSLAVHIGSGCEQRMREIAERGYPDEVCGLLVGTLDAEGWCVLDVHEVENLNRERAADRFLLDPEGYQRVDRMIRGSGKEIIGVFHSHPDCPAKPSPTDLANAWESLLYPIVSVVDGRAHAIGYWTLNAAADRFQEVPVRRESPCA